MRPIVLLFLVIVLQQGLAQSPIDSMRVYSRSFLASSPYGFSEPDVLREADSELVTMASCPNNRFQILQARCDSIRLQPNQCGRSCVDLSMVSLVFRGAQVDTISFSSSNSMVVNGEVFDRDDELLWAIATCLKNKTVARSIAAVLRREPNF